MATNWTDMIPLLAQIGGRAGAALSAQGGNQMGVELGNLASQMGQNFTYAFPQGASKALAQAQASKPVVQTPGMNPSAAESLTERQKLTPQTAAAMMGTAPSSTGANLSPFAAMMLSPAEQNAMSKMQMEKAAQPTDIAYKEALTESARQQAKQIQQSMSMLTPWQQEQLKREDAALDLKKQMAKAEQEGDIPRQNLLRLQGEALQRQAQSELAYMAAPSLEKKLEVLSNMNPEAGLKFLELSSKNDPMAKLGYDISKAIAQGAADFGRGPEEIFNMVTDFMKRWTLGPTQSQQQQQQQQTPSKVYDPNSGTFVAP